MATSITPRSRSSAGRSSSTADRHLSSPTNRPSHAIILSEEPSLDMLVLGCGGGPAENDLSAYWIKPAGQAWSEGFTSVDGGSCLGALVRLLDSHPDAFRDFLDQLPITSSQQDQASVQAHPAAAAVAASTLLKAGLIYDMLQAFLVTHAHWDHISGLVLSSSSGSSRQKNVYGSKQTISNLSSAMNGGLWPILGSYEAANGVPYIWQDVTFGTDRTISPSKGLSASIVPLSHGIHHQGSPYESSAFFVNNEATGRSLLIFGDVEPDSISGLSLNKDIWTEAARRISEGRLSSMLIECSYCSSRPKEQLYGHLTPTYIAEELRVLASLIALRSGQDPSDRKGRLASITVCIMHVKDPTSLAEVIVASPRSKPAPDSSEIAFVAPAAKKAKASPASSTQSTPSRRTRSASTKTAPAPMSSQQEALPLAQQQQVKASSVDVTLPEGIKTKIYNELQDLESRDQLGVRYLMLEQGMRIAF